MALNTHLTNNFRIIRLVIQAWKVSKTYDRSLWCRTTKNKMSCKIKLKEIKFAIWRLNIQREISVLKKHQINNLNSWDRSQIKRLVTLLEMKELILVSILVVIFRQLRKNKNFSQVLYQFSKRLRWKINNLFLLLDYLTLN